MLTNQINKWADAMTGTLGEIARLLQMALPLALSQLVWIGISTSDIWMMGRLGTLELAAGSLAMRFYQPFYFWTLGMLSVTAALMAQGLGARDARKVRRSFRSGLFLAIGCGLVFALPVLAGPWLLPYLGQEPVLADYAAGFFVWTALGLPVIFVFQMLRFFSVSMGVPGLQLMAALVGMLVNLALNELLALGLGPVPQMGLAGIALATSLAYLVSVIVLFVFVQKRPELTRWRVFQNWWRLDRPSAGQILKLGTPTGFIVLSETGMFAVASLMIGTFGAAALAASAIAFQVASIAFMVPLAVAQAGLVRIGLAAGAEDANRLRLTGRATLMLAAAAGFLTMSLVFGFRHQLIALFLTSGDLLSRDVAMLAVPMLVFTALFQIPECLQAVTISLLRGINDTLWPALASMTGYWAGGIGLAWLFGFALSLGPASLWGGLAAGLFLTAIVILARWFWQLGRLSAGGKIL